MSYFILELEGSIPREKGKLQHVINTARHERRRAKRRKLLQLAALLVFAALVYWRIVNPVAAAPVWLLVAWGAGLVLVLWCLRAMLRAMKRPAAAPAEGAPA